MRSQSLQVNDLVYVPCGKAPCSLTVNVVHSKNGYVDMCRIPDKQKKRFSHSQEIRGQNFQVLILILTAEAKMIY